MNLERADAVDMMEAADVCCPVGLATNSTQRQKGVLLRLVLLAAACCGASQQSAGASVDSEPSEVASLEFLSSPQAPGLRRPYLSSLPRGRGIYS
jgi:hypothetical protein